MKGFLINIMFNILPLFNLGKVEIEKKTVCIK